MYAVNPKTKAFFLWTFHYLKKAGFVLLVILAIITIMILARILAFLVVELIFLF